MATPSKRQFASMFWNQMPMASQRQPYLKWRGNQVTSEGLAIPFTRPQILSAPLLAFDPSPS